MVDQDRSLVDTELKWLTLVALPLPWNRDFIALAIVHGVPPPGMHIRPWVRGETG